MNRKQFLDSERERRLRIKSIISARGLDCRDSVTSDDIAGFDTERILEERLDKEQVLQQEIHVLNKQVHQLQEDI